LEPIKKILRTPSAFVILLAAILTLSGVIIKSESDKAIARLPIDATLAAEEKLTALASTSMAPASVASAIPTLNIDRASNTNNELLYRTKINSG